MLNNNLINYFDNNTYKKGVNGPYIAKYSKEVFPKCKENLKKPHNGEGSVSKRYDIVANTPKISYKYHASKIDIKIYTMCPADNATAGSWAGVGLVN
jgi:hypothetical protein